MKLDPTEDKTSFVSKPGESRIWNVSVRGWLALIIVGSVCFCVLAVVGAATSVAISSGSMAPFADHSITAMWAGLKELSLLVLGYYFAKELQEYFGRKERP